MKWNMLLICLGSIFCDEDFIRRRNSTYTLEYTTVDMITITEEDKNTNTSKKYTFI